MSFKLETCYAVGLPLIVISFEEIDALTGDESLAVVNSIVGLHITSREYRATIQQWDQDERGKGKTFEEVLWDDSVLRNKLYFKNDPFLARLETEWSELAKLGIRYAMSSLSKPDLMTVLKEKKAFDSVGCRYIVKGGLLTIPVVTVVWVRNFAGAEMGTGLMSEFFQSHGVNPLKVAENIAMLLGNRRALELIKQSGSKDTP